MASYETIILCTFCHGNLDVRSSEVILRLYTRIYVLNVVISELAVSKNSYLRKNPEKCAFGGKESEIVKNWSIDVFSDKSFIVISHV